MIARHQAQHLPGARAFSREGTEMGTVREVLDDPVTGLHGFVELESGLLGRSRTWVPVLQATFDDLRLDLPYRAERIRHAPHATLGPDRVLDAAGEVALREHYRVDDEYAGGAQAVGPEDEPPS